MAEDQEFNFAIRDDGVVEVNGTEVEEAQPQTAEPVPEAAPVDPAVARLQAELDQLAPFRPMLERLGRGEITLQEAAPPEPVPPAPEDLAQYFARVQSPRGAAIHEQVKAYAEFLPEAERAALETIPSRYNEVFDRIASVNQPPPSRGPGRDVIEKLLVAKEMTKDAARSVSSGLMHGNRAAFPEERPTGREAEINRLKRAIKMNPTDMDLATALAKHYVGDL